MTEIKSPVRLGHRGDTEKRFSTAPLSFVSAEGRRLQFQHGQECPLFDVDHPVFPLSTMVSLTISGALKDGSGEAVVTCDTARRVAECDSMPCGRV